MMTRAFWLAALERAAKTAAQCAVSLLGVGYVGVHDADWATVGSAAALAAVLSLLTSIGSDAVTAGGPSLAGEALADDVIPAIRDDDPPPEIETLYRAP